MKRRKLYSTTLYIFDESRARKADSCCHLFKNKKPLRVCLYVITLVCCVTTASHRWDSMTSLASQRPDGNDILSDMVVKITIAVWKHCVTGFTEVLFFCTLSLIIRIFIIIYDVLQHYYDNQHSPESWSTLLTSLLSENRRSTWTQTIRQKT